MQIQPGSAVMGALRNDARGFWIIWNPQSDKPSSMKFFSPDQARAVARSMAEKNPGECFYVMHAEGVAYKPLLPADTYTPL